MDKDTLRFLEAVLLAETKRGAKKAQQPSKPVVALSRDYGAGGEEVASLLADYFGVKCFDQEILNAVAKNLGTDPHLLKHLDERVSSMWDSWLRNLVGGRDIYKANYRRHLFSVVLGITYAGGIILGRGAHIILATRKAFRVRIVGSAKMCAQRIADSQGIALEGARRKVDEINRERERFVWDMYGHHLSDATDFDLIVNTDRYRDFAPVARLIITAMEYAGFEMPSAKP